MKVNEKMTFEEAITLLEELVDKLETGNMPIDKAMQAYEEGVSLVRRCEGLLQGYEKKITSLKRSGSEIIEVDFVPEGEQNND